ncbi:MAG: hypothetical protein R2747_09730 [Pyrinomonadaceae bacterium]
MLTTIEAEIDVDGKVRLLEPVKITKTTRAIVTLLEDKNGSQGNAEKMSAFLQKPEFKNRESHTAEEIEARIQEAKDSWE